MDNERLFEVFVALKDAEYVWEEYTKEDRYTFAVHKIGHAFVHYYLTHSINFEKITISPEESNVLGYVKDTKMMSRIGAFNDMLFVSNEINQEKERQLNKLLNQYYKETIENEGDLYDTYSYM